MSLNRLRQIVLAGEAGFFLLGARLLVLLPFRWIARSLGTLHRESPFELPARDVPIVADVARAVQAAGSALPFEASCLVRAIAVKRMLGWRHVPSTLYLGAKHDARSGLDAHAWLRAGTSIVTGEAESHGATEVARFS
jgi:hypothetical protein